MNQQQTSLRIGIAAILCALAIRLCTPQMLLPLIQILTKPDMVAFLIYTETGRDVRFSLSGDIAPETVPTARLSYAPESPGPALPEWIFPSLEDPGLVELAYGCRYRPDVAAMLRQPLTWNLPDIQPRVLIYHTHTTESYKKGPEDYEETAAYRTLNEEYNVLSIGDRVTACLQEAGITVIHDREVHDYPSYNRSYMHSRKEAARILRDNPGIQLVLDIHRDAQDVPGGQLRTAANVGGRTAAQIMIVVGTDQNLPHKHWTQNLSVGLKLHAQLESQTPGIVRPLCLRPQRFNQDLNPGALLIEVGAAGNSHQEAMLAADQLAQAIIAISRGTDATADGGDSDTDPPEAPGSDSPA